MKKFCKVTIENVEELYNDYSGDLYYRATNPRLGDDNTYVPAHEFELIELKSAIAHGDIEVIFISFAALTALVDIFAA